MFVLLIHTLRRKWMIIVLCVSWKWKMNWDIGSEMKFSVGQYWRISMDLRHAISRLIIYTWYEHQHYPHDPHQALHHVIVSRPPHFFSPSCAPDPSVFTLQWKKNDRSIVETLSDLVSTYFRVHLYNSSHILANENYRFKVNKINIFIQHNSFIIH